MPGNQKSRSGEESAFDLSLHAVHTEYRQEENSSYRVSKLAQNKKVSEQTKQSSTATLPAGQRATTNEPELISRAPHQPDLFQFAKLYRHSIKAALTRESLRADFLNKPTLGEHWNVIVTNFTKPPKQCPRGLTAIDHKLLISSPMQVNRPIGTAVPAFNKTCRHWAK